MRNVKLKTTVLFLGAFVVLLFTTQLVAQSCSRSCSSSYHKAYCRVDGGANYCSEFSACSIDRDLSGATGKELERYQHEKANDGEIFSDWVAPDFTLPTTTGNRVSLSDYRGRPVVLIFMSGHCSHCLDAHQILPELQTKYEDSGLVVLPVYINSGSVEDVHEWSRHLELNYPVLVSRTRDLSRLYDSRMVPAFFFIDDEGRITKKFVGYKSQTTLDRAFSELVNQRS